MTCEPDTVTSPAISRVVTEAVDALAAPIATPSIDPLSTFILVIDWSLALRAPVSLT